MAASAVQEQRLADVHARLAEAVAGLRSGGDWKRWLDASRRFHGYSFNNVLLIVAQCPDATNVAGYRAWQSLGRQVNRGERGIQILAPVYRRRPTEDSPPADEQAEATGTVAVDRSEAADSTRPARRLVGWRVAHVWDLAQTSGEPLPERPEPRLLSGQAPDGLWDALACEVVGRGFTLQRGDCGRANGLTSFATHTVTVRADVSPAQAVKTLAHELGHILLHDPAVFPQQVTVDCRGLAEVEAESLAYLITTEHGLDTSDYTFGYVTAWATGVDADDPGQVVTATGQRVLGAVAPLLDRLTPSLTQDGSQTAAATEAEQRQVATLDAGSRWAERTSNATIVTTPQNVERARLVTVHHEAAVFFRHQLHDVPGTGARHYLEGRGLAHVLQADAWMVGYAPPGWTKLTEHLRARGFDDGELMAAGLTQRSRRGTLVDRFRDRVMVGLHDADGHLVGFIGRTGPGTDADTPKYLNSPRTVLFDKGAVLFGLAEQRRQMALGARPVLVEGPLDLLAVHATQLSGTGDADARFAAVAPCGTALTATQAALMEKHSTGEVRVAFDADDPGVAAAARSYPLLARALPETRGLWAARLPEGHDPADLLTPSGGSGRLAQALANTRPLADLVVDAHLRPWVARLDNAEAKVAALRETAPAITGLRPADVGRQVARLATALDLDAGTVTREVIEAATADLGRLDRPTLRQRAPEQRLTDTSSRWPAPARTSVAAAAGMRAGWSVSL